MATDTTLGLQAPPRVTRPMDEGSIVKRNNCGKAFEIALIARDMHGGAGFSEEIV